MRYKVTVVPDAWETAYDVEVEADHYKTQATAGAGMIADFFTAARVFPAHTFARVISVQAIPAAPLFDVPGMLQKLSTP